MLDSIIKQYVKLALVADNLLGQGTIVDSYYGTPTLINDLPKISIDEVLARLRDVVKELERIADDRESSIRKSFLHKQIISLITHIQLRTQSVNLSYPEAIKLLLDVDLLPASRINITQRHNHLEQLFRRLGLKGSLPAVAATWRKNSAATAEEYIARVEECASRYLQKTYESVLLPVLGRQTANWLIKKNSLEFTVEETNANWSAYNYYERGFKGHIVFNKRAEFNFFDVPVFVAHEAYPGHHTSALIKETLYDQGVLSLEGTLHLLCSPESPIAEGIGEYAYFLIADHYDTDINTSIAIELDRLFTEVQYLATLQLCIQKQLPDEVKQFMEQNGLISSERAERAFRFLDEWKYYVPCYTLGFVLVRDLIQKYGQRGIQVLYKLCAPSNLNALLKSKVE